MAPEFSLPYVSFAVVSTFTEIIGSYQVQMFYYILFFFSCYWSLTVLPQYKHSDTQRQKSPVKYRHGGVSTVASPHSEFKEFTVCQDPILGICVFMFMSQSLQLCRDCYSLCRWKNRIRKTLECVHTANRRRSKT